MKTQAQTRRGVREFTESLDASARSEERKSKAPRFMGHVQSTVFQPFLSARTSHYAADTVSLLRALYNGIELYGAMETWYPGIDGSFDPDEPLNGINFEEILDACTGQASLTPCTQIRDIADAAEHEAAAQTEPNAVAASSRRSQANARHCAGHELDTNRYSITLLADLSCTLVKAADTNTGSTRRLALPHHTT